MDEVLSPVLHNKVPDAVVESVEVPLQLSTTVTTGVEVAVIGAAVPIPAMLEQFSTVAVTL